MYRISKVLNHNTVIAVVENNTKEFLIVDKGIGFGKKVAERFELSETAEIYSLEEIVDRGNPLELIKNIDPTFLEIANAVLQNAESKFDKVDKSVIFAMADHIEYAVKRLKNNETINNPLIDDIKLLFPEEYYVALTIVPLLKSMMNVDITEDEVGFIALHVHTAIENVEISLSLQIASSIHDCIDAVEKYINKKIDTQSISYHRLMNHVRFMVVRIIKREEIKLNINDYMETRFPKEFSLSRSICDNIGINLKSTCSESEIGYLAMHIQRVIADEEEISQ